MRKRTKILLAIALSATLACGAFALCFMALAATTTFFDAALLGGMAAIGLFTTTGTICGVSARIRHKMLKQQTEATAKILESKLEKESSKVNTKQLANTITKSNEVMVTNNMMGPLNDEGYSKNNPQRLFEQKRMLEGRRALLMNQGKTRQAESLEKRINKIDKTLDNSEVAQMSSRYSYKSVITGEKDAKIQDSRNQISCLTNSAKNEFESFIESKQSLMNRISDKDRNSYGYSVSLNFKDGIQKTFARSNSVDNMEHCELILLKEAKRELEKGDITTQNFPIVLKRKQFGKESKVADSSELRIENEQDLDNRINLINGYISNPEEYKSASKAYAHKTYVYTPKENENISQDEKEF